MQGQSPVAMRSSADLDRMQALLTATGIPAPTITPSFPVVKLDVAACYDQLNNSEKQRPEDLVMRQALELYCSLISPPTTPTVTYKSGYQFEQDQLLVAPSGIFNCEHQFSPSSTHYGEPKLCDYDPSTDPNRPFGFAPGQKYSTHNSQYAHQSDQAHYSWSTPSCVSDQENSDTDDMDDPFACYPLSHPRRLTPQSYIPQVNSNSNRRSSFEALLHKGTHFYSSEQRIQISAEPSLGPQEGVGMDKAVSADARTSGNLPHSLSRRSYFSPTAQPIAPQTKLSGRKRSFSVVTFVKQRKHSPSNAGSLRISGPMPIQTAHSTSSSGTFSVPVRTSRSSGGRLSTGGCLSPALEANEDLTLIQTTPSKSIPTRTSTRHVTRSSAEEINLIHISRKCSSRPETKSLWRTLKTTTSRPSFAVERPVV